MFKRRRKATPPDPVRVIFPETIPVSLLFNALNLAREHQHPNVDHGQHVLTHLAESMSLLPTATG